MLAVYTDCVLAVYTECMLAVYTVCMLMLSSCSHLLVIVQKDYTPS